jgi:hypothetical protein
MKNRLNKSGAFVLLMTIAALLTGCSDQFLKDIQNYNAFSSAIYNDLTGATDRVNDLYYDMLPSSTASIAWNMPSAGMADSYSQSTEEYGGLSQFVNPTVVLTTNNVPDYFYYENKSVSPYGYIRECNLVLSGLRSSTLPASEKNPLLGQAHFFRAWQYYLLTKMYGGVPLVTYAQNPILGSTGGLSLVIPRATTTQCVNFICAELDSAASQLPANWTTTASTNYGRVTAGTALALKGRLLLLFASPLFNRSDDQSRWQAAYNANLAAIDTLQAGGFGLAYANNPGKNGSNWAKIFSDYTGPEQVFVTLYNVVENSPGTNYNKNNEWELHIRPTNAGGGGGMSPTSQMIDLFPMSDGMKPSTNTSISSLLPASSIAYNSTDFFANRDPRFYRTFAFPGERWAFSGDPTSLSTLTYPYVGSNYQLWSYCWYANLAQLASPLYTGFAADGLGTSNKSVFIRKRTDDYDVNTSPDYTYDIALGSGDEFELSGAPFMEMRYTEVLLNLAESACGINHLAEAVGYLQQIRARVGYTAANNYGLDPNLSSSRQELFAAILYERQIELAYEGKRFDDVRRWMLFDGGAGQASLKSSWALTGFNGNTCTYLGVPPLNGTNRTGIEVAVAASYEPGTQETVANHADDPIYQYRPTAALNLMSDTINPAISGTSMYNLCNFYNYYLTRKSTSVDIVNSTVYPITFLPQYYFIGLRYSAQEMNVTLKQTIGWADFENGGANGTYDPLAQ